MFLPIAAVLGSCCGCMSLVEYLAREDPGCMDLMTFSTFAFIALEGFFFGTRCLTIPRVIPIRKYMRLVVVFFIVSVVNNKALSYNIPVPLHIIFRSGTLLASLILGKLILRRSYSWQKYGSVGLVTAGILLCTLASSRQMSAFAETEAAEGVEGSDGAADGNGKTQLSDMSAGDLGVGVGLLFTALILSSYLGICQEQLYGAYGKQTREALFYVHALSLPAFALLGPAIAEHARLFSSSPPLSPEVPVPRLWAVLLLNDVCQYACIRCVYRLTADFSALSVTLVVTLRKLLSLLLSILYFGSPFTPLHWAGAALVFIGTAVFSDLPARLFARRHQKSDKLD